MNCLTRCTNCKTMLRWACFAGLGYLEVEFHVARGFCWARWSTGCIGRLRPLLCWMRSTHHSSSHSRTIVVVVVGMGALEVHIHVVRWHRWSRWRACCIGWLRPSLCSLRCSSPSSSRSRTIVVVGMADLGGTFLMEVMESFLPRVMIRLHSSLPRRPWRHRVHWWCHQRIDHVILGQPSPRCC